RGPHHVRVSFHPTGHPGGDPGNGDVEDPCRRLPGLGRSPRRHAAQDVRRNHAAVPVRPITPALDGPLSIVGYPCMKRDGRIALACSEQGEEAPFSVASSARALLVCSYIVTRYGASHV